MPIQKDAKKERDTRYPNLISGVNNAFEVIMELGSVPSVIENLKRAAMSSVGGDEDAFLKTVARRLKYEHLLGRVVAVGDVGRAPKEITGIGWDTSFRIAKTKPEGEVQITPKTNVSVKYYAYKMEGNK